MVSIESSIIEFLMVFIDVVSSIIDAFFFFDECVFPFFVTAQYGVNIKKEVSGIFVECSCVESECWKVITEYIERFSVFDDVGNIVV